MDSLQSSLDVQRAWLSAQMSVKTETTATLVSDFHDLNALIIANWQ